MKKFKVGRIEFEIKVRVRANGVELQPYCDEALALFNFTKRENDELTFQKGDHLKIYDDFDSAWWLAVNNTTGEEGYIPSHYVAKLGSIEAEPYVFD